MDSANLQGEVYELLIDFDTQPQNFELNLRQDSQLKYQADQGLLILLTQKVATEGVAVIFNWLTVL